MEYFTKSVLASCHLNLSLQRVLCWMSTMERNWSSQLSTVLLVAILKSSVLVIVMNRWPASLFKWSLQTGVFWRGIKPECNPSPKTSTSLRFSYIILQRMEFINFTVSACGMTHTVLQCSMLLFCHWVSRYFVSENPWNAFSLMRVLSLWTFIAMSHCYL